MMKAAVLTGIRKMELIEAPIPEPSADDDVLLKVGVVGVCGSDMHYYTTGRIGVQVVEYPYRVGHECSAVVAAVGPAVKRVKPGDRVAVEPAISCGRCDQCRAGRPHTCRNLLFLGVPGQKDGCLCEYLVMPERCCFPIKPDTTLEQATLVEPLAIGLYSVKLAALPPGARIAVLGSGPIGLSVCLTAVEKGVGRVYAADLLEPRLAAARQAGVGWTGNAAATDVVAGILKEEPSQVDAVFECCGRQEALDQALELVKPGGKLILVGIPPAGRMEYNSDLARRKEISFQNVRRQNECVQETLDLIESWRIKPDFMVTHRFGLEKVADAFELVADYRDGVVKAMIVMG